MQDVEQPDRTAPSVSQWSIHQHVEHLALVVLRSADIIQRLNAGEGETGGRPKAVARLMLLSGQIPRGRGESPEFVLPGDAPDPGHVRSLIEGGRVALREAGPPRGDNRQDHPFLGAFTAKQWLRFAVVHTRHHLGIIRDIRAAAITSRT